MSSETKRQITWGIFCTVIGGVCAVYAFLYGYTWNRMSIVEAKQDDQTKISSEINAQLSQIQTDIAWIKQSMNNNK